MAKPTRACAAIEDGVVCSFAGEHVQVWKAKDGPVIRVFLCERHRRETPGLNVEIIDPAEATTEASADDGDRESLLKWAAEELATARDMLDLSPETQGLMSNQYRGAVSHARDVLHHQLEEVNMALVAHLIVEDLEQEGEEPKAESA